MDRHSKSALGILTSRAQIIRYRLRKDNQKVKKVPLYDQARLKANSKIPRIVQYRPPYCTIRGTPSRLSSNLFGKPGGECLFTNDLLHLRGVTGYRFQVNQFHALVRQLVLNFVLPSMQLLLAMPQFLYLQVEACNLNPSTVVCPLR